MLNQLVTRLSAAVLVLVLDRLRPPHRRPRLRSAKG